MPQKDIFHDAVKNALVKENWIITDDPLLIQYGGVDLYIDLGAERIIAAEKDGIKIAIEIKSFISPSIISEFHKALGQFMNYRLALEDQDPERNLYLAIPLEIYKSFFTLEFSQAVLKRYQIKLIIFDAEREVIVKWSD